MKIITSPFEIDLALVKLMRKYEKYHIATAWASMGSKASFALLENKHKIVKMIVGTHFYQTHPNFIDAFSSDCNVRFILKTDGVFHPKLYLFSNENGEWECLVGSANFTASALTKNHEMMTHFKSNEPGADSALADILQAIDLYWSEASKMTCREISNYKNIWNKNRQKLDALKGVYGETKNKRSILSSEIFSLTWDEYYKRISGDDLNSFQGRLDVLGTVQKYFTENSSFSALSDLQRKQVAGVINGVDINWKWFGSMVGAGYFKNVINTNNPYLSDALDQIPLTGIVTEADYKKYVRLFRLAFPEGGAAIATMTRMLAMKRPDYFVCLDSQNRRALCNDFSIAMNVTPENYWQNIILRITDSVWWSSPLPDSFSEAQAWKGRAAMIDSLFYQGLP
ncbi:TPA: phospholipase D family protein [Enterobacter chengduensis]|nr:phospholipase D family protein [Enterobacter chengduensis]